MAFCRTSRHLKHVHNVGGKCICTKTEKGEEKRPLITAIIIFQTDMSVAKGVLYLCDFQYIMLSPLTRSPFMRSPLTQCPLTQSPFMQFFIVLHFKTKSA